MRIEVKPGARAVTVKGDVEKAKEVSLLSFLELLNVGQDPKVMFSSNEWLGRNQLM